jgi:hypothetical protein
MRCPYKWGFVKCPISPCIECRISKRKNPPFPEVKFKDIAHLIKCYKCPYKSGKKNYSTDPCTKCQNKYSSSQKK